jgi:hypothetical protein
MTCQAAVAPGAGHIRKLERARALLESTPLSVTQLLARLGVGAVFFKSGMTKIASWEFTLMLFREEYRVPLLPTETAALLATATELSMPVLLALGLFARLATLPLLGMVVVIQLFVGCAVAAHLDPRPRRLLARPPDRALSVLALGRHGGHDRHAARRRS